MSWGAGRLVVTMMMSIVSSLVFLSVPMKTIWSWILFRFVPLGGSTIGVVQLNKNFFNVHWLMITIVWTRNILILLVVFVIVALARYRRLILIASLIKILILLMLFKF